MNGMQIEKDIEEMLHTFPFRENMEGKTFLVSGATGLIGSLLVRVLIEAGKELARAPRVIALARDKKKARTLLPGSGCLTIVEADMTLPLPEIPLKADYIIHTASPTASSFLSKNPVETLLTIHNGTAHLLEYARKEGVSGFVFLSSLESYGMSETDSPIGEDFHGYLNPMTSRSSYPVAKMEAECLCHAYWSEYGVPATVARLTQVLGAGVSPSDNRVFAQFARSILERRDIILHTSGESAKPYCYTTDAISAIFHILFKGKPGEAYNIANEATYVSIRELAEFLVKTFAPQIKVTTEIKENMGYAPSTKLRLDTRKLQQLGWQPQVGLEEMFRRLLLSLE